MQDNIREIAPHFLIAPPRIWENLASLVQVKLEDASFLKRRLYNLLMPHGYEMARRCMEHQPRSFWQRDARPRGVLCLAHCGSPRVSAHPFSIRWCGPGSGGFSSSGPRINLKQVYGQTESTVSCVQRDDQVAWGRLAPLPNVELKLSPEGEVIVRGPCVFKGTTKP